MIQKAGKYRQVLGSSTATTDGLKTTLEMMTSHNPWTEFLSRKHRYLRWTLRQRDVLSWATKNLETLT